MSLKPAKIPAKFERAPALVALRLRFREQQDNKVMACSPAVQEMKSKKKI
jgi:hypothetical protein